MNKTLSPILSRVESTQRQWVIGRYSKLEISEKREYYVECCKLFGVSPSLKPFDVINFNGKEILYPNSACIRQIIVKNNLSVAIIREGKTEDLYKVTVEVKGVDGRLTQEYAVVSISGCSGERLANRMMKCLTKAKRRAVLSHCGMPSMA